MLMSTFYLTYVHVHVNTHIFLKFYYFEVIYLSKN